MMMIIKENRLASQAAVADERAARRPAEEEGALGRRRDECDVEHRRERKPHTIGHRHARGRGDEARVQPHSRRPGAERVDDRRDRVRRLVWVLRVVREAEEEDPEDADDAVDLGGSPRRASRRPFLET